MSLSDYVKDVDILADRAQVTWTSYQLDAFNEWKESGRTRACLYYKTGSGKTLTSLALMALDGKFEVLVVAPPSTHASWVQSAESLGMTATLISHAKFRMKDYKLSRTMPLIVDEFHMLGGHTGKGWKKLDTFARGATAPLIICSATPNYNDAERVYCIKHVLEPHLTKGGYLEFLHQHCNTEHNPFGATPLVRKEVPFRNYTDAAGFLAQMDGVYFLPDDLVYTIIDVDLHTPIGDEFERYSYDARRHRIMASGMEQRHQETFQRLVSERDVLYPHVFHEVRRRINSAKGPVLIYAEHQTVALACLHAFSEYMGLSEIGFVSGGMSTKAKTEEIQRFKDGEFNVLIGTASLATGTDGIDKMCDTLIILDDTDDDAKRRQLVGRIMPRGLDTDVSKKRVWRIRVS